MYRNRYGHCRSNALLVATACLTIFYVFFIRDSSNRSTDDIPRGTSSNFNSDLEAEEVIQWLTDNGHKPQLPRKQNSRGAWIGTIAAEYEDPLAKEFWLWRPEGYTLPPKPPPKEPLPSSAPIPDPFPLLSSVSDRESEIQELRSYFAPIAANKPPIRHVPEATPLLIGFTRNWPLLLQCVSSYIAAGWPAEDIYVVENTGVMTANRDNRLSLQNPFYLNHTQLAILGANVIMTPTILTFSQLQNFYAWTALERGWSEFFWSHEDVVVFSHEAEINTSNSPDSSGSFDRPKPGQHGIDSNNDNLVFNPLTGFSSRDIDNKISAPYSLYIRALSILRYLRSPSNPQPWANYFFAYDHLTLVNTAAIIDVGGWDTHIPFYASDCDMYNRLMWAGYWQGDGSAAAVGHIFDVSTTLDDIAALFRLPGVEARFSGDVWALGPEFQFPPPEFKFAPESNSRDDDITEQRSSTTTVTTMTSKSTHRERISMHGEDLPHLLEIAARMVAIKYVDGGEYRNDWQNKQTGGQGEPFYRDPEGFQWGLQTLIDGGRRVFAEKWGHRGCDVAWMGVGKADEWRIERDWDEETMGSGSMGGSW